MSCTLGGFQRTYLELLIGSFKLGRQPTGLNQQLLYRLELRAFVAHHVVQGA